MEKNMVNYETPEVDVMEIESEQFFANSVGTQNPEDGGSMDM